MPELPEVEVVKQSLKKNILNKRLLKIGDKSSLGSLATPMFIFNLNRIIN